MERSGSAVHRVQARFGDYPRLAMDRKKMERACLLPFIDTGAKNAYKLLRTRLLQRMRANKWLSLIVTGIVPGDGKTTTAINLAIGASQDVSQAVLLVDLDLKRPTIAEYVGLGHGVGLSDYLQGNASVDEILYNTNFDRLALLPSFEGINSTESLIGPKMMALLDHVRAIDPGRLIIFDMPPVLSSDDVLAFAPHVDALLLVIAEGRTSRVLLQRANEMLEGIPRAGTVVNRSSEGNSGYDY